MAMRNESEAAVLQTVETLFRVGTTSNLTDSDLLESIRSGRAEPRQISDRRLGDRRRARPDEEEEGLTSPSLRGLGPKETAAAASGQVRLGRADDQSVGSRTHFGGRKR